MIKKIFLLIFLLTLFFLPNLSVSATISNNENVFNNDNMQEIIKENEKEISNLYDYIINMKDDIESYSSLKGSFYRNNNSCYLFTYTESSKCFF